MLNLIIDNDKPRHEIIIVAAFSMEINHIRRIIFREHVYYLKKAHHQNYILNEGTKLERIKNIPDGISLENTVINQNKLNELRIKFWKNSMFGWFTGVRTNFTQKPSPH